MDFRWKNLTDWLAAVIAVATVFGTYFVADRVYERMAHFEDEMAYVWQAQAISGGDLVLPSPPNPDSFLTPFVIDHNGVRFGKYPLGWPVILGIGYATGLEDWVNPLLAGLGIWLLYLLARRVANGPIGLLTMLLMLTSPMFWMLSGSLLSHALSLVLALGFIMAWLDTFQIRDGWNPDWRRLTAIVAGLCLGVLALTRPMNAIGVAIPFFVHGLILLVRGDKSTRTYVVIIGLLAALVAVLLFAWQFAVTGDPFLNPYTLWWDYDKYGFGEGYGRWDGAHTWDHAMFVIEYSFWEPRGARGDIFGWEWLWWIFLPFGMLALRKKSSAWMVLGVFLSLILVYIPYWIGSWQYGPRYYYEGMIPITLLTAAGVFWLWGNRTLLRKVLAGVALTIFVGYNLITYLPSRLWKMHNMYNINRSMLEPFYTVGADEIQPAIIIVYVQDQWTEYGGLLELQNAQLSTPFIFALNRRDAVISDFYDGFPERQLYHYYPDDPFTFYQLPRRP